MKNFVEFLAERDPNLLQEYIDLASLSENAWYKYLLPLMLGTQATTQAGTPTPKQVDVAAEDRYQDPTQSKDEKQLYKRMALGGHTFDSLSQRKKSREELIANMQDKVNAAKLPTTFRPGIALNHIEDNYKPEEILFRKIVNPYEIIKSNIPDPEKFQKDYNNLKSNPNDIGFSMDKDALINNRVLLVVVTDQAMKRFSPGAEGYAGEMSTTEDPYTSTINTIFLPKSAVKENKNGKSTLTDEGEHTFRHEARHTAQEGDPGEREQNTMSKFETGWFKHYMNDPKEIGVRLGELKNHLSDETLLKLTKGTTHYNNMKEILEDAGKDGKEKEKELLKLFMGSIKYKNTTTKKEKMTPADIFLNSGNVNPKDHAIEYVKKQLAKSNEDMGSLFKHYDSLSDTEKSILMQELLDNYDNVVKNDTKTFNSTQI